MNRLLRSLSISKSETPPPLPIIIPQPDPTPNDPPILPAEESAPDSKPQSKETSGALGRLKSLTKFKKEKKGDVAADSILAEVAKETLATPNKEQPTPLTLAQKIRQLVDGLPPVTGNEPLPKSKPVKKGPGGKPIPPTSETPINDPTLIAQLSTPSIMNGSDEKGAVSVWSVLEALGAPQHDSDGPGGDGGDDGTTSDNSSVMMYAPLIPTADSTVELATTELRPVTRTLVVEEEEVVIVEESENGRGKAVWLSFPWPSKSKPAPQKMIKTWVPSKTKLSVQTTWWGYRLYESLPFLISIYLTYGPVHRYLPPPVLVVLSAKEIQATKRAAMITTALQWIISHLPISIVPLELQPAVLILQRIAPYLTYIGSFIAWSWATVDGFDKGVYIRV